MATPSIAAGEGRTRWRRFGLAGGIGLAAVALIGYLAMTGALALSFAISGIPFTLNADTLTGTGFVQYAYPDAIASNTTALLNQAAAKQGLPAANYTATVGGQTYVADTVTQFNSADIGNLSQSICAPVPFGYLQVNLSGTGNTHATNLVIQAPGLLAGTATFNNITIGETVDSATSYAGVTAPYSGIGNSFAQGAHDASLTGIKQVGVGTEAGSFAINNLSLYAQFVSSCG